MTTWTAGQISQAEGIRSKVFVDDEVIARSAVDVRAAVREQMFRSMAEVAHTFGIEIHPGDLEFRDAPADVDEGEPRFTTRVTARWHPTTREVELFGGARDGEVMAFEYAGDPISTIVVVAPINLSDVFASSLDDVSPPIIETGRLTYSLAGWNEETRRWVYGLDAR